MPGSIAWLSLDFTGSNITDIVTRNHADLQNLNTASYTHLTSTQATDLTDGGDSTLHYHSSDRDLTNATGVLSTTHGGTGSSSSYVLNGVLFANTTSTINTSAALTFDGTTLTTTGNTVLGDAVIDTLTYNTGSWFLNNLTTVDQTGLGLQAAGSIRAIDHSITYSGDAGGTTNFNGYRNIVTSTGANAITASVSGNFNTAHSGSNTLTTGRVVQGTGMITSTGNVTNLNIFTAQSQLTNSGSATQINGYTLNSPTFSSTGTATTYRGFLTPNLGALTAITNLVGFDASSQTATTTLTASFRSLQNSATGSWGFLHNGTANNAFQGNVRIGSVVAPTVALDVTGSFTVSNNAILGDASSDTVLSYGIVKIGGTVVTDYESAYGAAAGALFAVANSASVPNGNLTVARFSNDAVAGILTLRKGRGTASSGVITNADDSIGTIAFSSVLNASTTGNSATILASMDGTPSATSIPGRIVFNTTASGSTTTTERMRLDSLGRMMLGTAANNAGAFEIGKSITGAVSAFGLANYGVVQSDVTTLAAYNSTTAATAAASFTVASLRHYQATQGTIGAGSTVTEQVGFRAGSTLTGATSNYGFYGDIASSSGRWNFFANGTANNAFNGNVRIGSTVAPTVALDVTGAALISTTLGVTGIQSNSNKIYPGTDGAAAQSAAGIYAGTGVPSNSNGSNGDYYFRSDGGTGTHIYFKSGGTWAGIV